MLRLTLHSCARRRCDCYEVRIVLVHVTFDTITRGKECVEALYEGGMSFEEVGHTLYDARSVDSNKQTRKSGLRALNSIQGRLTVDT